MNAPTKLLLFVAGLLVLFGGGAVAGNAIDPDRDKPEAAAHAPEKMAAAPHRNGDETSHGTEAKSHGAGEKPHNAAKKADHPVRGVAVAENGLRLALDDPELRRGTRATVRFRILDGAGGTVRKFDVEHTKRMHVIVARRDLSGFQHLHPQQRADGSWSLPLTLDEAGSYRFFADFSHEGEAFTLATDLRVDGRADLQPLPEPTPVAFSDGGYEVRLEAGRVKPGKEADLRFTVTKDGNTVHTEPYLGAGGHLVALREGDLAFLHVHPTEHGHGEKPEKEASHDDSVGFAATFPTQGRYRLFLQFQHADRVQTVAFTHVVR